MMWLNPVAFLGLLALAVPILVHLFGRRMAKRQSFPSLRLLREAKPTPVTRSRPSDVLLLVLRCLTIATAVVALAQPRWSAATEHAAVRAIVIDTSASMQRLTTEGRPVLQQARAHAQQVADSSGEALVLESDRPGAALAGAASWLSRRRGVGEIVVISDFQAGAVADGHLAALAPEVGIRMLRVAMTGSIADKHTVGGIEITASPERTGASWPPSGDSTLAVTLLASDADRQSVASAAQAARALVPRSAAASHAVSIVFPGSPERRALVSGASPLDSAWQGDLFLALRRDPLITTFARAATVDGTCEAPGTIVAHNDRGAPLASVATVASRGLLVFACVEPGSTVAAAIAAAVEANLQPYLPSQEAEPMFLPDEILREWERPATPAPRGKEETSPDGRWIWLIALAFLAVEEVVRRRTPRRVSSREPEVRSERVA